MVISRIFPAFFCLLALLAPAPQASAQSNTSIPTSDEVGADLDWLKRYSGSVILDFKQVDFDEFDFVAGPLLPQDGMDARNNSLRIPETFVTQTGRLTRFLYLLPEGRSPLEAIEGYRTELDALGGTEIFACKQDQCGGAKANAVSSGGNQQGLINHLYGLEDIPEKLFSPGYCVMNAKIAEQRYALLRAERNGAPVHLAIFAGIIGADSTCQAFNGRTAAFVTVVEGKPREQNMETITKEKIEGDIAATGRIALYGILFDTDQATIKPESEPQLAEIAAFLNANPAAEFLVVGHTDNQGAIDYNLGLSDRRAKAVIAALAARHGVQATQLIGVGVGMAAPAATNVDEAGRALNRRVEIVQR